MIVWYAVVGDTFTTERPRLWADVAIRQRLGGAVGPGRPFDLHPDGDRVAVAPEAVNERSVTQVVLISNFFDELRRSAPVRR